MFEDPEMQSPLKKFPKLMFGEDMQTVYGNSWTGAKVAFGGHCYGGDTRNYPNSGPYEHIPPAKWDHWQWQSEGYRRCCTSVSWPAEALALRMLHAEKIWDHDAFFDYVDRWMTEDNSQTARELIRIAGAADDPKIQFYARATWWVKAKRTRDPFVQDMWDRYRNHLPQAGQTSRQN
jgi:hypothetical protein